LDAEALGGSWELDARGAATARPDDNGGDGFEEGRGHGQDSRVGREAEGFESCSMDAYTHYGGQAIDNVQ
jgi:hypothetical protein